MNRNKGDFDLFGGWNDQEEIMPGTTKGIRLDTPGFSMSLTKLRIRCLDKLINQYFDEDFIPLLLKEAKVTVEELKRPSSIDDIDFNAFMNSILNNLTEADDIFEENDNFDYEYWWHNAKSLDDYMYSLDYVGRLFSAYLKLVGLLEFGLLDYVHLHSYSKTVDGRWIIEQLLMDPSDEDEDSQGLFTNTIDVMSAVIFGLIASADNTERFPQTLEDAFQVFCGSVREKFNENEEDLVCGIVANFVYHCVSYFANMPKEFHAAFPAVESDKYDKKAYIEKSKILKLMIDRIAFDFGVDIDKNTVENLYRFLELNDKLITAHLKSGEKYEFALSIFLIVIRAIPLNILKDYKLFWQNPLVADFIPLLLSEKHEKIKTETARDILLDELKNTKDLDLIVFLFIIAKITKDEEMLTLIDNKDEIKSLAYDYNDKLRDLIDSVKDRNTHRILGAIESFCISRTEDLGERLIAILQNTSEDIGVTYNPELTVAICDLIEDETRYNKISEAIRNNIKLDCLRDDERKKIHELVIQGEYQFGDRNIKNYSPSVNQWCSALECLLHMVVYEPYYFEIQNICLKKGNHYFYRDANVKALYFGDIKYAMSKNRDGKLSLGLKDLSFLMKNILLSQDRKDIFVNATKDYFCDDVNVLDLLAKISDDLRYVTNDRNRASHGELIGYDEANEIRAKLYKNEIKKELNPNEFLLKISKDLK